MVICTRRWHSRKYWILFSLAALLVYFLYVEHGGYRILDNFNDDTEVDDQGDDYDDDLEEADVVEAGNITEYWLSSAERADPHVSGDTRGRAKRLPQALIIGVKKAGTESLVHFLGIHPKIKRPSQEIHFFDKGSRYRHGLSYYQKQMPYSSPDQITIEKTPNYFDNLKAVGRIRRFNSSIKLIIIVRDPTKRLISDYTHNYYHPGQNGRMEHWVSFKDMVFHENGTVNESYRPVWRSMYHLHLTRWYHHFPREQILVLDGERFMREPYHTCKLVESFLGLPPYIREDHFVFSKTKNFFCKRIHGKTICMGSNKGRKHKNVSEESIKTLNDFFRPHNKIFENMLNYTFSWP